MEPTLGFVAQGESSKCKLNKVIYDLKRSPRVRVQ